MVRKLWHGAAFVVLLLLLISSMVVVPSRAQAEDLKGEGRFLPGGVGDITVTNGIYTVTVAGPNSSGGDPGTYTVSTGASHPNPNQNVLYGGAAQSPGSTYNTVRFYGTFGTGYEYCPGSRTASTGFTQVDINNVTPTVAAAGNIITATWNLAASSPGPQAATVTQVTAVEGTTLADSRVRFTTTVTNNSVVGGSLIIGIRYLWDVMIATHDNAVFQQLNPASAWLNVETTAVPPGYTNYQITDNALTPTFVVQGSVTTPPFTPAPTPPARVSYAYWGNSFARAFDYTTVGAVGQDSAVLYYWGGTGGMGTPVEGIVIAPGASTSVTQYLYTTAEPTPTGTLTVTTGDPTTGLTCTSATLTGTLGATGNLNCDCFDVYFEWGNTPGNWDNKTPPKKICRGDPLTFTDTLTLMPCMTYYVRAVAVCSPLVNVIANNNGYGNAPTGTTTVYGEEHSFNTMFCCTSNTSRGGSGGLELTSTRPYLPPMFDIPAAKVSATKAAPGEQVEVTATITNKGGSNGTTKVILYVNGQEADSKGIALSSGQSAPVSFKVSRNDPGTYQVHVNAVPAGSFTVDLFNANDMLIYCSVALFAIGLIGLLYYVMKRRKA